MKEYLSPKINAIELDTEQAILQICWVGGIYINRTTGTPWCGRSADTTGTDCNVTPKGAVAGGTSIGIRGGVAQSAAPS